MNRDEVRRVATLARLALDDAHLERAAAELSQVLEFATALERLDLAGLAPTVFAPENPPLRADGPDGRTLDVEQALAAASAHDGAFFLVPPIVENLNP